VSSVALYGRTYLDAELEIPIAELAAGKGKVDVEVTAVLGGFPCNAARALVGRLRAEDIVVVTAMPALDLPRLRAALPPGTTLEVSADDSLDWPPITVIVNPARECRLLRSGRTGDLRASRLRALPAASLHVFGRVEPALVGEVRRAAPDAFLAWCGGATAAAEVVRLCDLACVNLAEARALLAAETGTTRELALALAEGAPPGGVRVVTGRGDAPAVAAVRSDRGVECFESAPDPIARGQIRRLKGAGDVFAAHFVVEAVLDGAGQRRDQLDVARALSAASARAAAFMTMVP
jgi:hypothetical protein